ncbi:hypothetical protein MNBD_GAMMA22-1852 [hydrothermal vent metagenome]|uniref:N-acetyltransferase domain-containing protein n=1 Tax=hydrothermal vent metagenome TaxID=652676 RepID=A0A3B0ZQI7_9ZZZZ
MELQNNLNFQNIIFEQHLEQITFIQNKVFVEEQNISKDLEWDNLDSSAYHLIINSNKNKLIAYARLLLLSNELGKLRRVTVLKQHSKQYINY